MHSVSERREGKTEVFDSTLKNLPSPPSFQNKGVSLFATGGFFGELADRWIRYQKNRDWNSKVFLDGLRRVGERRFDEAVYDGLISEDW